MMHEDPTTESPIPDELRRRVHWVMWRYETRGDKVTKVPYKALFVEPGGATRASSTDPSTWQCHDQALRVLRKYPRHYDGIGYVLTEDDGIVGVDLDNCYGKDGYEGWPAGTQDDMPTAERIVRMLNSYTEVTPSGRGLRIFVKGTLPPGRRRVKSIEMYSSGRFLTVTGNSLPGLPVSLQERTDELATLHAQVFGMDGKHEEKPEAPNEEPSAGASTSDSALSDDDIIRMAGRAANGSKFRALWGGSTAGYATASEADQALCSILAFWTQDFDQIDRLMRRSGLARNKWNLRHDYRVNTINRAMVGLRNTFGSKSAREDEDEGEPGPQEDPDAPTSFSDQRTIKELLGAPLSDAGNAECMVELYRDMFRYDHIRKKWLIWDGVRWQLDEDGEAERAALDVVRERRRVGTEIQDKDWHKRFTMFLVNSENAAKRKAMLSTAAVLGTFTTIIGQYDADQWLTATPNGTLDLRTGLLREALRDDMLTMRLGARYDVRAKAVRWLAFLQEVFGGDQELINYVQRAVGYSLTGSTREQKMFLLFGDGMNGKSKFLAVLTALLGDYAGNAAFSTFDGDRRSDATNDLAGLKGKRLVTVIETNEDRRLDEARVKAVTGEDQITCRFLYCEPFTYVPTYKLWMAVNHKPVIRGTDRGIWRRIQLIPFLQNFEGIEDVNLEAKLLAELSGILNWAIEGLQQWRELGLGSAESVEQATAEYKKESDLVGQWFADCCAVSPPSFVSAADAYGSYKAWCKGYGYRETSQTAFGRNLETKGFKKGKERGQRGYIGFLLTSGIGED